MKTIVLKIAKQLFKSTTGLWKESVEGSASAERKEGAADILGARDVKTSAIL
jgi:hypothetical protein